MGKRLFVGGLPYSTTEDQLKSLFSQAGTVDSINLIINRDTGQSKGFAFIEMASDEEAKKATEMYNGYKIADRALVVNEARPRENRTDRPRYNKY